MKRYLIILMFSLTCAANPAAAKLTADAETIDHDPFEKPEINRTGIKSAAKKAPHWAPRLSMTLRAGNNSMANVGGRIIRLHESIDGHRLIAVHERSVVFKKQGKIIRLNLDKD